MDASEAVSPEVKNHLAPTYQIILLVALTGVMIIHTCPFALLAHAGVGRAPLGQQTGGGVPEQGPKEGPYHLRDVEHSAACARG